MSSPGSLARRLPAGAKLVALGLAGTGLTFCADFRVIAGALVAVWLAYRVAGLSNRRLWEALRPLLWLLAPLLAVQGLTQGWEVAAVAVGRIVVLVALANWVTLTTPTGEMISTIERALSPLRFLGVDTGKVALAFSLALRFLPVVGELFHAVREAQRARGMDHSFLAMVLPMLVRALRMSDEVAEAIEARTFRDDAAEEPVRASAAADTQSPSSLLTDERFPCSAP